MVDKMAKPAMKLKPIGRLEGNDLKLLSDAIRALAQHKAMLDLAIAGYNTLWKMTKEKHEFPEKIHFDPNTGVVSVSVSVKKEGNNV